MREKSLIFDVLLRESLACVGIKEPYFVYSPGFAGIFLMLHFCVIVCEKMCMPGEGAVGFRRGMCWTAEQSGVFGRKGEVCMRTIRVTGKGMLKVHPDMTRITITLEGLHKEYGKTLQYSSEDTETLKDLLAPFGFERKDLKTLSFKVDTEYESYKEKDTWKNRFIGYKFTHVLKVEFESDNKRLGKILYALANGPLRPELRLSYTVKDPEAVKNALLGKAVQDAIAKAGVLAGAAGLRLGEIQSVDYSWGEIEFEYRPMDREMKLYECLPARSDSYDVDIEPDDVEVQDTVTVVWEIG